jgi:uncharacterized protein YjbI with pentapeptide repeats
MPNRARLARDITATKSWRLVAMQARQGWRWLRASRGPITWAALRTRLTLTTLPLPKTNGGRLVVVSGVGVLLLQALLWYASGERDDKGVVTYPHASLINPILGGLGALFLIYAAIRQAQVAADRHAAQTSADLQRRITETFSKAIEQLGDDKLEVRLGGIYALERISQESPADYWTVMENLTAFVREGTQRTAANSGKRRDQRIAGRAYGLWEIAGRPEGRDEEFWRVAVEQEPPEADIEAVLTVIKRRSEHDRVIEAREKKILDFRGAVLRCADLRGAHLDGADLRGAHLNGAFLVGAHLDGAHFSRAHLDGADLRGAHLNGADLRGAHLNGANLSRAHLDGACLRFANLSRERLDHVDLSLANLSEARLDGADLRRAEGLTQAQIDPAFGDVKTELPEGLTRPARWTAPKQPFLSIWQSPANS